MTFPRHLRGDNPQRDCESAYSGFGRGCYSNMEQFASSRAKSCAAKGVGILEHLEKADNRVPELEPSSQYRLSEMAEAVHTRRKGAD